MLPFLQNHADSLQLPTDRIKVEDGDTLIINIKGDVHRIQLSGIDAPEDIDNPKLQHDLKRTGLQKDALLTIGNMATNYLRRLIQSGATYTLHYQARKRDRYGRLSGDLLDDKERSISALMVKNGYAVVARRSIKPQRIQQLKPLQDEALKENKGIWGKDKMTSRIWAGLKPVNQETILE